MDINICGHYRMSKTSKPPVTYDKKGQYLSRCLHHISTKTAFFKNQINQRFAFNNLIITDLPNVVKLSVNRKKYVTNLPS